MRAPALALCIACVLAAPSWASSGAKPDQAQRPRPQAVTVDSPGWWQGRQHYLFDETNSPQSQTDGRGSAGPADCFEVLKRTDGVSITRRSGKCDE